MTEKYQEYAPAKVNLTLRVLGRMPNGYHELVSLVAFARDVCDVVTVTEADDPALTITGPFAPDLQDLASRDNTIARVLQALRAQQSTTRPLSIEVRKGIPVSAGLGGGSADAAALMRVLSRNTGCKTLAGSGLLAVARSIGADVPVCLAAKASWMAGIGERVQPLASSLPQCFALLINTLERPPGGKTKKVFERLAASKVREAANLAELPHRFETAEDLMTFVAKIGNDLEASAGEIMPEIRHVQASLSAEKGCRIARMSGAGPTVFGLFQHQAEADQAKARLQRRHPDWWMAVTALI